MAVHSLAHTATNDTAGDPTSLRSRRSTKFRGSHSKSGECFMLPRILEHKVVGVILKRGRSILICVLLITAACGCSAFMRRAARRFSTQLRTFDSIDRHSGWSASNWGANVRWGGSRLPLAEPASLEELQEVVKRSSRVRCIGSAHSFTPLIGDDARTPTQLVSLRKMPRSAVINTEERTLTVDAGMTYSEVCCLLASHPSALALSTTASLPHFSIGGAVATGTHGSSGLGSDGRLQLSGLADAVTSLDIIGPDGEVRRVSSGVSADFACSVTSLGMVGVVTKLTLRLVPAYDVRQRVYGGWPPVPASDCGSGSLKRLLSSYHEALRQTDSLSAFVLWDVDDVGMLICRDKLRRPDGQVLTAPPVAPREWAGASLRHDPIEGFLEGAGAFEATSTGQWCDKMHIWMRDALPLSPQGAPEVWRPALTAALLGHACAPLCPIPPATAPGVCRLVSMATLGRHALLRSCSTSTLCRSRTRRRRWSARGSSAAHGGARCYTRRSGRCVETARWVRWFLF